MKKSPVDYKRCRYNSHQLMIREVRILKTAIKAKSENAAAATLKAQYLNREAVLSESEIIDVEIRNAKGVELEIIDSPIS